MYESDEAFSARTAEWEASLPHEREYKPKGNSMTQKYYCRRLLPYYIDAIQLARLDQASDWVLQEDNDPSHGTKNYGLANRLKDSNWVGSLQHPPQSPDLNPMEGIWNILKQRVRRRTYTSLEDLKAVLQDKWNKVSLAEIRTRIQDMPRRCRLLVEKGGKPIKTELW